MKKDLLIIGGGYAGTQLVSQLKNTFNITLVDENNFHIEQTEIHRYIAGKISLGELAFPYEEFAKKNLIQFVKARVDNIDFENNRVYFEDTTVSYDYVVLATGSKTFFPKQIKNLDLFKKDIKSLKVIKQFKEDFFTLLESPDNNKNIIIAGGGLSGIEIAIELAQKVKQSGLSSQDIKVTIVEQQDTILPGSHNFLIQQTKKVLDELHIECVHGEFITEVEKNKIILSNKEEINYDLSLFVLGVGSEKLNNKQNIELNIKNQYIVDDYFQINYYNNAFCIGDFAQTLTPEGKYNLPTAQLANKQASLLALNLKNLINKKDLIRKELILKGVLIDLGTNNAVGLIGNLKLSGYIAYILKRFTSYLHKSRFR